MDIDYKQQVLYGVLQRMAPASGHVEPLLQKYWVCSINPKNSPKILTVIKEKFQHTSHSLRHLKRMQKVGRDLKVLICPFEEMSEIELKDIINGFLDDFMIEYKDIPMNKPFDKEINMQWSQNYWPLLWKGNPIVQDLNEIYKSINIDKVHKYMNEVVNLSSQAGSGNLPIVTIFVDPKLDKIISVHYDKRGEFDPIKHSVMDCISQIASDELIRRKTLNDVNVNNYLCLNYHVYTTHEPCVMCSMALVHSRISQLVYLKSSAKTGGIGKDSGHRELIHLSCALNWKFEAFQYLNEKMSNAVMAVNDDIYV